MLHKFFIFITVIGAAACKTTELPAEGPVVRTHYTLQRGSEDVNTLPLPNGVPVTVTWHYSNGLTKSHIGFREWDFNKDKIPELVEQYDEKGELVSYICDFNSDGKIDLVKKRKDSQAK